MKSVPIARNLLLCLCGAYGQDVSIHSLRARYRHRNWIKLHRKEFFGPTTKS